MSAAVDEQYLFLHRRDREPMETRVFLVDEQYLFLHRRDRFEAASDIPTGGIREVAPFMLYRIAGSVALAGAHYAKHPSIHRRIICGKQILLYRIAGSVALAGAHYAKHPSIHRRIIRGKQILLYRIAGSVALAGAHYA